MGPDRKYEPIYYETREICAADILRRAFLPFHREATQFKAQTGCYGLNFKSALEKIKESFELETSVLFFIEIQLNIQ